MTIDDLGYVDRDQARKGSKGSFSTSEGYKKCERLLAALRKHPNAVQFMSSASMPGYEQGTREAMDLTTLERKLKSGAYPSSFQFALDARKIWSNSWSVNHAGSDAFIATTEISNYFEKLMKELGEVQILPEENSELQELKKKVKKVDSAIRKIAGGVAIKAAAPQPASRSILDRPMSTQEKAQLKQNIMKLPQEKLQGVIAIIQSSVEMPQDKETLEFDIDKLPVRTCRELDQYVKKSIQGGAKAGKKRPSNKSGRTSKQDPPQEVVPVSSRCDAIYSLQTTYPWELQLRSCLFTPQICTWPRHSR